jgi:hypothetical protein
VKRLTLTLSQTRLLMDYLESQNQRGYTTDDLKVLDQIASQFDPATVEYRAELSAIDRRFPDAEVANRKRQSLDETMGAQQRTYKLEDAYFRLIADVWRAADGNFTGQKAVRRLVVDVDRAMKQADAQEDQPDESEKTDDN